MKVIFFVMASALAVAAGTSNAQVSRAEVKAEAAAANRAGDLPRGEYTNKPGPQRGSSEVKRAEVKAGTAAANRAGDLPRGEYTNKPEPQRGSSEVRRAEVKAETAAANRAGDLPRGEYTNKAAHDTSGTMRAQLPSKKKISQKARSLRSRVLGTAPAKDQAAR